MAESIKLIPHCGQQPVRDANGQVISTVDVPVPGMNVVVHVTDTGQRQIGFHHEHNGFVHFCIPDPPQPFKDWVKDQIEALGQNVGRVAGPPPIEAEETE